MAFKNIPGWASSDENNFANPMREDFENSNFNSYNKGPGASLDSSQQPGSIRKNDKTSLPYLKIYIKGVPIEMSDMGLENLCKTFGQIVQVRSSGEMKYIIRLSENAAFVMGKNLNESERIITGLNAANDFNFCASFAKQKTPEQRQQQSQNYENKKPENTTAMPEYLDMENRQIKGPFGAPTKITPLMETIVVAPEDYDNSPKLRENDPNMDFCGKIRNEFSKCSIMNSDNVANGVSHYRENHNVMNGIQKMANQRPGQIETNGYNYQPSQQHALVAPARKCVYCKLPAEFQCKNCGDGYCSRKCQKIDWPSHKPVCVRMPDLIPTGLTEDLTAETVDTNTSSSSMDSLRRSNMKSPLNNEIKLTSIENNIESQPSKDEQPIRNRRQQQNDFRQQRLSTNQNKESSNSSANENRSNNLRNKETSDSSSFSNDENKKSNLPHKEKPNASFANENRSNNLRQKETSDSDASVTNGNKRSNFPHNGTSNTSFSNDNKRSNNFANANKSNNLTHKETPKVPVTDQKTATSKLEMTSFPVSGSNVLITAVIDHRCFYIRSLCDNFNKEYIKDANDVAQYAVTAKSLSKLPERGDLCLAEFEGEYYRALAINITSTKKIKVAFVDFGNTAEKSLDNLKEISNELKQRRRFTHKIVLKNVPSVMLNDKCLAYLNEFVEEMKPLQLIYTEQTNVTLNDLDRKMSLETYLIKLNVVQAPIVKEEIVMENDLKRIEIKGENIDVVVLDTSCIKLGYMACCSADHITEIMEQGERIKEYCENIVKNKLKKTECYTPRESEVCLVKFTEDDSWYRGVLIESVGDGNPSISFIDFGNISIVNNKHILPMPKEFAFPLYTHFCMIEDVSKSTPMGDKLSNRLAELLPINQCLKVLKSTVDYDANGDAWSMFTLPEIRKTLEAEHLISEK